MTPQELAALHDRCFTVPRPWRADEFEGLMASDGVIVCEADGGFLLGRVAGPEAEVLTLAVAPEQRRKGIAVDLMRRFEKQVVSTGVEQIFLEVTIDNTAATALYENCGFVNAGIRKNYYADPRGSRIDAVVMSKTVSAA